MDIVEKLNDLRKQAITEHSHYYVAETVGDAIMEIHKLRTTLEIIAAQDSGEAGSAKKVDCMAALAQLALRASKSRTQGNDVP